MRKLLIGIIQVSGKLLNKLADIHRTEAQVHTELALQANDKLCAEAKVLTEKAQKRIEEGQVALEDGRIASRKSRQEAARCQAVADVVLSIN